MFKRDECPRAMIFPLPNRPIHFLGLDVVRRDPVSVERSAIFDDHSKGLGATRIRPLGVYNVALEKATTILVFGGSRAQPPGVGDLGRSVPIVACEGIDIDT